MKLIFHFFFAELNSEEGASSSRPNLDYEVIGKQMGKKISKLEKGKATQVKEIFHIYQEDILSCRETIFL